MAVDAERGLFLSSSAPSNTRLWVQHTLRTNTRAVITVTIASTLLLSGFLYASDAPRAALDFVSTSWSTESVTSATWPTQCTPQDFSDGTWQRKSPSAYPLEHFLSLYPYNASDPPKEPWKPSPEVAYDPFAPLGFAGCASGRERSWHLGMENDGTPDRNHPEFWGYVVRGASYDWVPKSDKCRRYNEHVAAEEFVRSLAERGGWFLVGDSVTEQHFFSLSCQLYPHVRATPDYEPTGGSGPRDWPQHLYLNPTSPLVGKLSLPTGFDIANTPLVTFRRVDLLFSKSELDAVHRSIHNSSKFYSPDESESEPRPDAVPDTLFGPKASESYNLSPTTYMPQFTASLPQANYRTLIVSTAGHWTTGSLPGAREVGNISAGATNPAVYKTFVEAVKLWTTQVSNALKERSTGQGLKNTEREVFIRAYLPGHEYDCHNEPGPIDEVRQFSREWYNWSWIGRMNEAFKSAISSTGESRIRFLGLDRMALLRPDAHALSDCLHIQVGAGIFEGWSRYIWHFGDDRRGASASARSAAGRT